MRHHHLVVDLGGVLFAFDHAHRLQQLAAVLSLPLAQVDKLLWKSGFSADCDSGRYTNAAQVRDRIRGATGFTGSNEQLDIAWCSAFRPDHRVRETLVRHRGSRSLTLFTNNGPLEEEVLLRLYPEMFNGFGQLLFSYRLGRRKPDPGAFVVVSKRLGAEPGEILFIDDSPTNIDTARSLGWTAIQFRGPETIECAPQLPIR
ncbi:HAD family phosphatase [Actinoallomurus sp. NBC_01490]|jgi:putative hydrolase of the HAD superfamily|uniref:HAD family hydrolase n=1 Tax=Actinoallomurus sp. NBC_01490 TaxID=2903557 RepID=UPI002E376E63|nr:HAD family phosphatase [Actinoallomurus sp. NBC_01490]